MEQTPERKKASFLKPKTKEQKEAKYISIDMENMYFFSEGKAYNPDFQMKDEKLSDGTDIKLFFEYYNNKGFYPSVLKEFVTRRTYVVNVGHRNVPGSIMDTKFGTVAFEREGYPEFFKEHLDKEQVLAYFDQLKSKGVYREYVAAIQNFYSMAKDNRKGLLKVENEDVEMGM